MIIREVSAFLSLMPKDERLSVKINDRSVGSWGFSVIHPPPLLLIECPIDKFILTTPFTHPREGLSTVVPFSFASPVDLEVSSCARCASFSANTLLATIFALSGRGMKSNGGHRCNEVSQYEPINMVWITQHHDLYILRYMAFNSPRNGFIRWEREPTSSFRLRGYKLYCSAIMFIFILLIGIALLKK